MRNLPGLGIDLGGTKIEGVVLDSGGVERARARLPAVRDDYRGTVARLRDLVGRLEAEAALEPGRLPVGIGMPGSFSPKTGLVRNANSTWLNGQPFDRDVAAALDRPVKLENDANCLALSEAADGAGADRPVVFAAILGTGVGAGIALDGRVWSGANGIAGEWGHNPLPWPGPADAPAPPCYCGRAGCLETYLSGPGLARDHRQATGRDWRAQAIARAAAQGDAGARAALDRHADRLARGLAAMVNLIDPSVVVLAGGVSNIARLYEDLPDRMAPYLFSDSFATPIRQAVHGDASGVRGAARLWAAAP